MSRGRYQLNGQRTRVVPVVLEVLSYDDLGRPNETIVRYDEDTLDLAKKSPHKDGRVHFWIIFMDERHAKLMTPNPKAKA